MIREIKTAEDQVRFNLTKKYFIKLDSALESLENIAEKFNFANEAERNISLARVEEIVARVEVLVSIINDIGWSGKLFFEVRDMDMNKFNRRRLSYMLTEDGNTKYSFNTRNWK